MACGECEHYQPSMSEKGRPLRKTPGWCNYKVIMPILPHSVTEYNEKMGMGIVINFDRKRLPVMHYEGGSCKTFKAKSPKKPEQKEMAV